MSTARRPRISVVLDREVVDILKRVATVQERSVSSLVGELVTDLAPGLKRVALLGEAFEKMSAEQRDSLKVGIEAAEEKVSAALLSAMESAGLVQEQFEGVTRAALDGLDQGRPPYSNTGVR